jgi:hypothetical protein
VFEIADFAVVDCDALRGGDWGFWIKSSFHPFFTVFNYFLDWAAKGLNSVPEISFLFKQVCEVNCELRVKNDVFNKVHNLLRKLAWRERRSPERCLNPSQLNLKSSWIPWRTDESYSWFRSLSLHLLMHHNRQPQNRRSRTPNLEDYRYMERAHLT